MQLNAPFLTQQIRRCSVPIFFFYIYTLNISFIVIFIYSATLHTLQYTPTEILNKELELWRRFINRRGKLDSHAI